MARLQNISESLGSPFGLLFPLHLHIVPAQNFAIHNRHTCAEKTHNRKSNSCWDVLWPVSCRVHIASINACRVPKHATGRHYNRTLGQGSGEGGRDPRENHLEGRQRSYRQEIHGKHAGPGVVSRDHDDIANCCKGHADYNVPASLIRPRTVVGD